MGFYLEVPNNHLKAEQMKELHGAVVTLRPKSLRDIPKGKILLCVVQNGSWDAIGIVYSEQELKEFTDDELYETMRPRTWMLLDVEEAVKMKPHLAEYLRGERDWDE